MYLEWYLKEKKAYEKTLEETVTELLSEKHLHVTTAESCTGGLISGTLVNAAGASAVLNEGYVTYSNEAKERLLGVSHARRLKLMGQSVNRRRKRWRKERQKPQVQKRLLARQELPVQVEEQRTSLSDSCI